MMANIAEKIRYTYLLTPKSGTVPIIQKKIPVAQVVITSAIPILFIIFFILPLPFYYNVFMVNIPFVEYLIALTFLHKMFCTIYTIFSSKICILFANKCKNSVFINALFRFSLSNHNRNQSILEKLTKDNRQDTI